MCHMKLPQISGDNNAFFLSRGSSEGLTSAQKRTSLDWQATSFEDDGCLTPDPWSRNSNRKSQATWGCATASPWLTAQLP